MSEAKQLQEDLGVNTVVKLKYPVKLATGQMLEQVTLRRLRVGDLRAVSHLTNEAEQELALFARMTGMVPEDLDCLDLADWKQMQETFRRLTETDQDGK
ncbi:TPA: phage tail assembly protein [Neisseria subflava]